MWPQLLQLHCKIYYPHIEKKGFINVKIQILKAHKETWTIQTREEGNINQADDLEINLYTKLVEFRINHICRQVKAFKITFSEN